MTPEDEELARAAEYTWDDVCHTRDCTHDNPACGAWPELQAIAAEEAEFGGCSRDCRRAGKHTLVWGSCVDGIEGANEFW